MNKNKIVQYRIYYNRDNDIPWVVKIGRKEHLVDYIDMHKCSCVSATNSTKQPKAFIIGRGEIIFSKAKNQEKITCLIRGEK